jgi:hypothetical protein
MSTILRNKFLPLAALACAIASPMTAAAPLDLRFTDFLEVTDGQAAYNFGPSFSGASMHYTNVATQGSVTVDARVTAYAYGDYKFNYHIPNYNQASGDNPNDDIAFIYSNEETFGSGGLTYIFELFDGAGANSGTFNQRFVADELAIIAYDIDGENTGYHHQTESLRVYTSNGITSYQTGAAEASVTVAFENDDEILFTGPGNNVSETDTSGAVKITYENTDRFVFQFESETFKGGASNPVFSAIDGDLTIKMDGATVYISEPETLFTMASALFGMVLVGRRKNKKA